MPSVTNYQRLQRLFSVMLPIFASQIALVGMQVFDSAMSGHAGPSQLAGSSIGGSLMMPIIATSMGVLSAATPIIAQLIGKEDTQDIGTVVRTGIIIGLTIESVLLLTYAFGIDSILGIFTLTPEVHHIAKYYMLAVIIGLSAGMITFPLRCLVETMASTAVAMRIYLSALPINALLNYCFIYGHFGAPQLGGIGAGIATGITYYIVLCLFILTLYTHPRLKDLNLRSGRLTRAHFREYLGLGIPNSLGIFMEASIFGFIVIFISKFGTDYIAAHQAAMSFSGVCYMLPLSYSLALTIIEGVEVGAGRIDEARRYARLSIFCALGMGILVALGTYFGRHMIAEIYAVAPVLLRYIPHFLAYTAAWQLFDAVACPTQGILRGYKDVTVPFIISMLTYWGICLPLGLLLDFYGHQGPFAYWQSLVFAIFVSAVLLSWRLRYIEHKFSHQLN